MWSDWIRSLFDKELFYLKLTALADKAEDAAHAVGGKLRAVYEGACDKVAWCYRLMLRTLLAAVIATVVCAALWVMLRLVGVKSQGPYQVLLFITGLGWTAFLTIVMIFVGLFEALASQFKVLEKLINDVQQSVLKWLRIPAWVAFVTLFLIVLVGRFPSLREPGALLSLVGIGAAVGLASFLGLLSLNAKWIKRFIAVQLLIALVLLLIAPQFPHVTAWVGKQTTRVNRQIGGKAASNHVQVDPTAPPAFFDPITGEGLFYFSGNDQAGYVLWDGPGFDSATSERLQMVDSKERRDKILAHLRTPAQPETPAPTPPREPRRIQINRIEDIRFVDHLGSNLLWYFGSAQNGYELYDAPGYHRTGVELKAATAPEDREAIVGYFRTEMAKPKVQPVPAAPVTATKFADSPTVVQESQAANLIQEPKEDPVKTAFTEATARKLVKMLGPAFNALPHGFSLQCTEVRQTRTTDSRQGVSLGLVVIRAQFRLDPSVTSASAASTITPRNYDAKATFHAGEFYNLTDPKVVERIADSCVESIKADREAVIAMRRTTMRTTP